MCALAIPIQTSASVIIGYLKKKNKKKKNVFSKADNPLASVNQNPHSLGRPVFQTLRENCFFSC